MRWRPEVAPISILDPARRGREVGRFCRRCRSVFPLHTTSHRGKGIGLIGKDHVISTCVHEGEPFTREADWWEPAVEIRPTPTPAEE